MSEQVIIYNSADQPIVAEYLNRSGPKPGRVFLIEVYRGAGVESFFALVEAHDEGCALDILVDSDFGHLVIDEEQDKSPSLDETHTYAGNEGRPIRDELIHVRQYRGHIPDKEQKDGYGVTS